VVPLCVGIKATTPHSRCSAGEQSLIAQGFHSSISSFFPVMLGIGTQKKPFSLVQIGIPLG
jgi:hypothetical protein